VNREESIKYVKKVVEREIKDLIIRYNVLLLGSRNFNPEIGSLIQNYDMESYTLQYKNELLNIGIQIKNSVKSNVNLNENEIEEIIYNSIKKSFVLLDDPNYVIEKCEKKLEAVKLTVNSFSSMGNNVNSLLLEVENMLKAMLNFGPLIKLQNVKILEKKIDGLEEKIKEKIIEDIQLSYQEALGLNEETLQRITSFLEEKNEKGELNNIYNLLLLIINEIGYTEKDVGQDIYNKFERGRDNRTKYTEYMNEQRMYYSQYLNSAWCDIFVDSLFVSAFGIERARELLQQFGGRGASSINSAANFVVNKKEFLDVISGAKSEKPIIGDQIFFVSSNNIISHTGIVVGCDSEYVYVVEGNTLPQTGISIPPILMREGRGVYLKRYKIGDKRIQYYGSPGFSSFEYFKASEDTIILTQLIKNYYECLSKATDKSLEQKGHKVQKGSICNPFTTELVNSTARVKRSISIFMQITKDKLKEFALAAIGKKVV